MRVGIDLTAVWRPTAGLETVAVDESRHDALGPGK